MINQWVATPATVQTSVDLQLYFDRTCYLVSAGYTLQFKAASKGVYCLLYTGGMNRRMLAIECGANPADALDKAMQKAGIQALFNVQLARG